MLVLLAKVISSLSSNSLLLSWGNYTEEKPPSCRFSLATLYLFTVISVEKDAFCMAHCILTQPGVIIITLILGKSLGNQADKLTL